MVFICELPNEVQKEIRADIISIANKLQLDFPCQLDDVAHCETVEEYADEIMNEKLINIIGYEYTFIDGKEVNMLLDYDKYNKFL